MIELRSNVMLFSWLVRLSVPVTASVSTNACQATLLHQLSHSSYQMSLSFSVDLISPGKFKSFTRSFVSANPTKRLSISSDRRARPSKKESNTCRVSRVVINATHPFFIADEDDVVDLQVVNLCELQVRVDLPGHCNVINEELQDVGFPENEPGHTLSELDELCYGLHLFCGRLNVDEASVEKVKASLLAEDQALRGLKADHGRRS